MDALKDRLQGLLVLLNREIVRDRILNHIPIHAKDSLVVGKHTPRDLLNVSHDVTARAVCRRVAR